MRLVRVEAGCPGSFQMPPCHPPCSCTGVDGRASVGLGTGAADTPGTTMVRAIVLIVVLVAIAAPTARAASDNGLYKPYPGATSVGPAEAYYAQLGLALTAAQLRDGRFTGSLSGSAASGPSERAGASGGGLRISALAAVMTLALLAAAVASLRRVGADAAPHERPLITPHATRTDMPGR
jgi:hypothetical protein